MQLEKHTRKDKHTMRTEQELLKEALAVQDASNLCGISRSFSQAMSELYHHTKGTTELNTHRITRLWASKIISLTGDIQPGDFNEEN